VKIRGFRIEPGEVEAALHRLPEVVAAVVAPWAQPGRPAELAAYVVPARPGLTADDLRRALAAHLPAPLVPSAFVLLEALPTTPGGKVDRRRLPAPERPAAATAFLPPGTESERELAAIWAEVLGLERVGLQDNFFDLGGHSLLLPRVQARVKERLGVDLPLLKLFEHPTVGALAAKLTNLDAGGSGAPDPASRERARRQRAGLEAQRQRLAARRSTG
jgi:acyl carrier protein